LTARIDHTEKHLLQGLQNGDKTAFYEIFERYWDALYNAAYIRLRSHAEAEEIVQELFVTLWDKRHTLKIDNLPVYLHVAVRKRVLNTIRRKITEQKYWDYCSGFFSTMHNTTEDMICFDELSHEIEEAVNRLPERSRQVFKLNKLEGKPVAEIAKFLKLSERSIEYDLARSLKAVRLHLKDYILLIASFIFF
jgi:RNA polymerase sigma-70 factor (ECF subfamily)